MPTAILKQKQFLKVVREVDAEIDEAIAKYEKFQSQIGHDSVGTPAGIAHAYALMGKLNEARRIMAECFLYRFRVVLRPRSTLQGEYLLQRGHSDDEFLFVAHDAK